MKLDHIQSLASYNRLVSLGNFTPAEAAAAGRLLAELYGVPLEDAHNLGEAP